MRMAAAEGAGLGMGGMFTMLPDLGILAAITLRMLQKLSLIYGFPYNTEEEEAELWVAAASAAGVDISRELLEKQFVSKFVPRVIQRIAVSASAEIVEKWTARLIPVISSVIGAGLNYYFVRVWGERALGHFRQRHFEVRRQQASAEDYGAALRRPALLQDGFLDYRRRGLCAEFSFPLCHHHGCQAVAEHVHRGARHVEKLIDAEQKKDRLGWKPDRRGRGQQDDQRGTRNAGYSLAGEHQREHDDQLLSQRKMNARDLRHEDCRHAQV